MIVDRARMKLFRAAASIRPPSRRTKLRSCSNRIRWWVEPGNKTFSDFLFNCPPALEDEIAGSNISISIYPADAPPVFFGHYWLEDKFPVIQSENVVCVDYSVAKEGALVAYRWSGEGKVDNRNFVFVN